MRCSVHDHGIEPVDLFVARIVGVVGGLGSLCRVVAPERDEEAEELGGGESGLAEDCGELEGEVGWSRAHREKRVEELGEEGRVAMARIAR